ncbi:MAG TPA: RNA polymerase sigma-70 factor [Puia sp.]|nr:RNA polymerase sigma-70 factor [Puia sp.]
MTADQSYDELHLLQQVADGDENAYRQLYEKYWNRIYSVAFAYTKSAISSQDIVQETFMKVWVHRAELPQLQNFGGWLHTIAKNLVINQLKKLARENDLKAGKSALKLASEQTPDQQLVAKQMAEIIHEAVSSLPPQQQRIYRMSREEGLKLTSIADQLGISHNTVREHMSKALKNIRAYLAAHPDLLLVILVLLTHT